MYVLLNALNYNFPGILELNMRKNYQSQVYGDIGSKTYNLIHMTFLILVWRGWALSEKSEKKEH